MTVMANPIFSKEAVSNALDSLRFAPLRDGTLRSANADELVGHHDFD